jgi:hypothetical protein
VQHLAGYTGLLQADAYAGYNDLLKPGRSPAPLTRALCWAHARRKFFELADIASQLKRRGKTAPVISPLAAEAVRRIDAIFEIERAINGKTADERLAVRKAQTAPLVADLERWLRNARATMARHTPVAGAIDYMLKAWDDFARFLTDGRICLTNNAAERAMRGIAMRESLCTPSSSVCKHWKRVYVNDATRATFSGDRRFDWRRRQVIGADLIRRSGDDLLSRENAGFHEPADRVVCHAQRSRRLRHGEPCAIFFGRPISMDAAYASNRSDTVRGPGLALTGGHAHPV